MIALTRAWRSRLVAAWLTAIAVSPAFASETEKTYELVALHDLSTTVAIGNYYLKQRILLAVREEMSRLGTEKHLGSEWNPTSVYWRQAESALVVAAVGRVQDQFSNLEWLSREWAELDASQFSEAEVDRLLEHFKTPYGRKQLMVVDHGVALNVQGALTFTGKMVYEVPGAEVDRREMQTRFSEEDRDMRFDIDQSPESTRFVMSSLGRRYFVNAMLNVSGMICRRIEQTAASIPAAVRALSDRAQPAVDAFLRSRTQG